MTWRTKSATSVETERLAEKVGRALKGGEVIELVSDLGGGKTTFVRGLVRATGSQDMVTSPTFTISKVYDAGSFQVHHFDFYRLQDPGIVTQELAEVAGDPHIVTIIEWADIVQKVLPEKHVTVQFKQKADGVRAITIQAPKSLAYLMKEIA